ncbi:hypothetical protein D3C72_792700 [compost metagenome]
MRAMASPPRTIAKPDSAHRSRNRKFSFPNKCNMPTPPAAICTEPLAKLRRAATPVSVCAASHQSFAPIASAATAAAPIALNSHRFAAPSNAPANSISPRAFARSRCFSNRNLVIVAPAAPTPRTLPVAFSALPKLMPSSWPKALNASPALYTVANVATPPSASRALCQKRKRPGSFWHCASRSCTSSVSYKVTRVCAARSTVCGRKPLTPVRPRLARIQLPTSRSGTSWARARLPSSTSMMGR